ncbi:MAG: AmmeMemoRadiSam system radical SAM enzyme [Patescibacteria group bacterium]|nr:AmmeMemoRadiSam system radical SAM enzyme [Patescibacteria group bacterium]
MKKALLYKKKPDNKVKCQLCNHHCLILPKKRGLCGVRENREGELYSLVYGKAISENIDPIEKKPFFHFLPGTLALSFGTLGCNFRCANCQNWQISQAPRLNKEIFGQDLPPKKIVQEALENDCQSIAYTYTEPTIFFEYALETMKLAHNKGLKNVFVSNGFMTKDCLKIAKPFLDAINIDLKFFDNNKYKKYCHGKPEPILENLKTIKKMGLWLEITTLAIPTLSDQKEMFEKIADFIKTELGEETPWHISRFSGAISHKLDHLPDTPLKTLYQAYDIAQKKGLKYVYLGNVPGDKFENTYCPKCGSLIIERIGYNIKRYDKKGQCPKCQQKINLINK